MSAQKTDSISIHELLLQVFGQQAVELFAGIGEAAQQFGSRSFLIGGSVRDALRGIRGPDIDIMIEGDASAFIEDLKLNWSSFLPSFPTPSKAVHFRKFGTAKLFFSHPILPEVQQLDFSSARSEVYESSGSAPKVSFSDLASDLKRRDFSMNALAIELTPSQRGKLHDLFEGQKHLQAGELHILHAQSFEDDPARLIRGVRFGTRFDFSFGSETQKLFEHAVQGRYLQRVPLLRRVDEFRKALTESKNRAIFDALYQTGLVRQLHPELEKSLPSREQILVSLDALTPSAKSEWHAWLVSLFAKVPDNVFHEILKESRVSAMDSKRILSLRQSL